MRGIVEIGKIPLFMRILSNSEVANRKWYTQCDQFRTKLIGEIRQIYRGLKHLGLDI